MSDQNAKKTAEFRAAVVAERQWQLVKRGQEFHTPAGWLAILMEEVGEAAEAVCETWSSDQGWKSLLHELVQVAAVAETAAVDLAERASLTIEAGGN